MSEMPWQTRMATHEWFFATIGRLDLRLGKLAF